MPWVDACKKKSIMENAKAGPGQARHRLTQFYALHTPNLILTTSLIKPPFLNIMCNHLTLKTMHDLHNMLPYRLGFNVGDFCTVLDSVMSTMHGRKQLESHDKINFVQQVLLLLLDIASCLKTIEEKTAIAQEPVIAIIDFASVVNKPENCACFAHDFKEPIVFSPVSPQLATMMKTTDKKFVAALLSKVNHPDLLKKQGQKVHIFQLNVLLFLCVIPAFLSAKNRRLIMNASYRCLFPKFYNSPKNCAC